MQTAFLRSFLLAVDSGSMAAAARRLNLTPAAVAQQIRSLEQEVGAPLLRRAGRTVRPTEAGHRILDKARSVLREADELIALAGQAEMCTELRLGTIYTALVALLPAAIDRLSAAHPELHFHIRSAVSSELFDAILRGELDAAVCLHPPFALPKTLGWQLLREERLVALVPRELAECEVHQLLRTQPFIRYERKHWGGQQVERYLRQAGIVPQERMELGHLAAIADMVGRRLGVALVPDTGLPADCAARVVKRPLPAATPTRRLGLLWLRPSPHEQAIRLLGTALQDATQTVAPPPVP